MTDFIKDLDEASPAGTDLVAQVDNQIRELKAVLKRTFPALDSAVTVDASVINAGGLPVGAVIPWYHAAISVPTGYLTCDGALYLKTEYELLYEVISDLYRKDGDISTHFRVPNLLGTVLVYRETPTGVTNNSEAVDNLNSAGSISTDEYTPGGLISGEVGHIHAVDFQSQHTRPPIEDAPPVPGNNEDYYDDGDDYQPGRHQHRVTGNTESTDIDGSGFSFTGTAANISVPLPHIPCVPIIKAYN